MSSFQSLFVAKTIENDKSLLNRQDLMSDSKKHYNMLENSKL